MHRRLLSCATALLLAATAAFCADDADREGVVRSLLERSRFLGDVQFSVPLGVWRDYVREAIGGPEALFPAPVGLIAEEGLYHLTLSAERIPTLSVTLRFRVFQPDKCPNIPVLPAIWAWDKVSVNGQPAHLATVDRWLRFSPEKPGLYSISAEVRLKEAPTYGASVDLPIPATVQTAVQFDSPDAWEVTVPHIAPPLPKGNQAPSQKQRAQAPSGQGETRVLRGAPGQGTHGTVALTQRQHLTIAYGPLAITTEKPAVYELRGDLSWNIDVATQQIAANLSVAIIGGSAERLELALPAGAERVAVSGPDVREVQGTTVFLRGKIREHTRLHVAFELPLAKGSIQKLGGLTMRDGHWGGGTLVISNTAGSSELIANSAVGLSELATADVPDSASAIMAGPLALAYEITARDWSVEIDILDLGEFALRESIADLAHYEIAFRDDGAVMCKASYEIRNRTRQFLRVTLPADATLLVTRVNEKPVPLSPVAGDDGVYLLPLVRSMASVKGLVSFPVEVVFVCRTGALDGHGEAVLPLPRVDLPIAYAWCEAYLPQGMEVVRWAGPLKRVERYSSETAVAEMGYGRSVAAEGYKPTEERRKPALFRLGGKAAKKTPPKEPSREDEEIFGKPEERGPVTRGTWLGLRVPWGRARSAEKAVALEPGIITAKPEGKPATAEAPPPAKPPGKSETRPAPTNAPSDANKALLAKNYYRAGRDYYERGDLENATKLLEQTRDLAPSSPEAANAERLLANLKVVQGKGELKSRAEKAAGVEVQRGIAEAARPMEQQQQEFLERGFQAAREGRGKEATAQFKAAEALGQQLVTKGADVREQSARLRTAKEQLAKAQKEDVSKAGALLGRLETLKRSGNVEQALQTANELRSYQADLSDADKAKLQSTLEDLTLRNVRKEAESARRRNLEKQFSELAAEVGKYKAQDARTTIVARFGDMDKKMLDYLGLDWDALEGTIAGVEHGLQTGRRGEGEPADLKDLEKKVETLGKVVRERRERVDERGRQPDRPALPTTPLARMDEPVMWSEARDFLRLEPMWPAEVPSDELLGLAVVPAWQIVREPGSRGIPSITGEVLGIDPETQIVLLGVGSKDNVKPNMKLLISRGNEYVGAVVIDNVLPTQSSGRMLRETRRMSPKVGDQVATTPEALGEAGTRLGFDQAQPPTGRASTSVYDVRSILRDSQEDAKKLQESLSEITEAVDREALGDVRKGKPEGNVQYHNGKLIVTGSPEAQKRVRDVLNQLESARGPQVQLGTNIAGQRAQGLVQDLSGLAYQGQAPAQQQAGQATQFGLWDVTAAETSQTMAGVPFIQSGDLNSFIYGNYGWALQREAGGAGQARQVAAGSGGAAISVDDLVNKLGFNLGQKVQVGSINLNVDENSANGVGINFQRGNNDVRFAVIDEAQFRTLMQLDARNPKLNMAMDTNERRQDTIVGTDALIANGWVANVQFAGDRRNTIDINDNPIALPHEKYVVVSNGDFVTAVRASEMQHWTQQGVAVQFAEVPQDIDVPRVGQMAKFEKTLVSPEDDLVIRAVYNWKGDER